jgi:hypothetical protein
MNKDFFNVSKIINNKSQNVNLQSNSLFKIEKNVDTNVNNNNNIKQKMQKLKNNLEKKDKKSLVSYDESKRRPVTFPKKFNWRLFAKIVNHPSVNNEEKAIEHFKKYAHNQSKLAKLYFRAIYKIPDLFDEDVYIDYLKTFDLNLDKNTIEIEKLYHFFSKTGHVKYPLNDKYHRLLFNIPYHFDYNAYCNRYSNVSFDREDVVSIYDYFNSDKNTKHHLDDEYGRQKYNIPSQFCKESYKKRYSDLNFDNDFDLYEFYSKNCENGYSLDEEYLKIRFNIPDDFDIQTYKSRYIETDNFDTISIYNFYHTNKNYHLDDEYYKILYKIPDDFDKTTYLSRYPNIKYDDSVYKYYSSKGFSENTLDDQYYRILYDIPDYFDISVYSQVYSKCPSSSFKESYKFYNKNKNNFSLDEKYFSLYFKIDNKLFDWNIYKKEFLNDNTNKYSMYETYKHFSENNNNDEFYIKILKLDEDFNWETFYNEYHNYYLLDNNILQIDKNFIFNFIGNNISLNDIYNQYKNNNLSDKSNKFIKNYEFLQNNLNKQIKNEIEQKYFFNLHTFIEDYDTSFDKFLSYYDNYNEVLIKQNEDLLKIHTDKKSKEEVNIFYSLIDYVCEDYDFIDDDDDNKKNIDYDYILDVLNVSIKKKNENLITMYNTLKFILNNLIDDTLLVNDCYFNKLKENFILNNNFGENNNENENENDEKLIKDNLTYDFKLTKEDDELNNNINYLIKNYKNCLVNKTCIKKSIKNIVISMVNSYDLYKKNIIDFTNQFNEDNCFNKKYDKSTFFNTINYKKNSDFNTIYYDILVNKNKLYTIYNDKIKNNTATEGEYESKNDIFNKSINYFYNYFHLQDEIVLFMVDLSRHNSILLDHYLSNFGDRFRISVIVNNLTYMDIYNYKHIDKINVINFKETFFNVNNFNKLLYNRLFWNIFNSRNILFITNNILINKINNLNFDTSKFLAIHSEKPNDKSNNETTNQTNYLPDDFNTIQSIFVNRLYIMDIIDKYNKGCFSQFYPSNLHIFKKKYNLDNVQFHLFLKNSISFENLGNNIVIEYLNINK